LLRTLEARPEAVADAARRAKRHVATAYCWEVVVSEHDALFCSLVGGGRKAA
jgi:hypothetical protein